MHFLNQFIKVRSCLILLVAMFFASTAWAHTIIFETGDENINVASISVENGEVPTRPADPLRKSYKFLGWYTNSSTLDNEKFDWTKPVSYDVLTEVVLYAKWKKIDKPLYIDGKGDEKELSSDFYGLSSGIDGSKLGSGWYVVDGDVVLPDIASKDAAYRIILKDGSHLTVDSILAGNIIIYGQKEQTGSLTVRGGTSYGIASYGSLEIDGGNISVGTSESSDNPKDGILSAYGILLGGTTVSVFAKTHAVQAVMGSIGITGSRVFINSDEYGLFCNNTNASVVITESELSITASAGIWAENGNVNVGGGTINITVMNSKGVAMYASMGNDGSMNLNAGSVTAEGPGGLLEAKQICLNGATVKANSYYQKSSVEIKNGLQYADENGLSYTGTISDNDALAGKTLFPVEPNINISYDIFGAHATINGNYIGAEPFVVKTKTDVDDVTFNREFATGVYSTIVLPFNVKTSNLTGVDSVLSFAGVGLNKQNKMEVQVNVVWEKSSEEVELQAYTPYIIKMENKTLEIFGSVSLLPTVDAFTEKGEWEFRGTYSFKKWTEESSDLDQVYGFAGGTKGNVSVGEFVKLVEGASICPLRAYLIHKNQPVSLDDKIKKRPDVYSIEDLPDRMNVVVVDKDENGDEHTTVIGQFNTRTGEFRLNQAKSTFDLKGRAVGKSKARGAYYGKILVK